MRSTVAMARARNAASLSALALALMVSAPVAAQEALGAEPTQVPTAGTEPTGAQENAAEDIVVTGSRIPQRPDFQSSSPIQSITAATLQTSGLTNLTDFLTGYPALQGSSSSADNSGSGAGIGATGLNLLNLRNLGTERTLVLIDGRRHVASVAGSQAIDINSIPSDLIERVDVLTGGASAIYGADGVSGVVNFVLKKDFEGVTASGQAGITQYGDAGQRRLTFTAGRNFAEGRGNIALAYEYGAEDRLQEKDRDRLRSPGRVSFVLNPDDPENQGNYTGPNDNGIPDTIPLNDIRYYDTAREGGIDTNFDGFPDFIVNRAGQVVSFDNGRFIPDFFQQGGSGTSLADYGNDLLPNVRRHIVNAIAHYDVGPAMTLFAEGKFASTRSVSFGQPTFDYYLPIDPSNPFVPDTIRAQSAAETAAGTCDDPDTVGLDTCPILITRDNFDFGQRGEDIRRKTYRVVLGSRGAVSDHANYEISYVWGRTNSRSRYLNDRFTDRFAAAYDVVTNPTTGQPDCRVNVDPALADTAVSFSPGQCRPLNLFGDGAPSRAALDFILVNPTDRVRLQQQVVSGSIAGDFGQFFRLPGGPVGFAIGVEYRKESSRFTPDRLVADGLTFTNLLSANSGSYDVKEAFGELRVPVLADQRFAQRLEFGAAVRVSDYSTIGNTTAWKLNGSYAPIKDITFNGTYSKAVRAPNIGELFNQPAQTFSFITDPCNNNQLQNGTQFRAANCAALLTSLGADPAFYRDTRSTSLPGFSGGNQNLSEESAKTWTAGAVLQPRFLPGLSVRADWYNIRIGQAINTATASELAELCVDQPTLDNQFCPLVERSNGLGAGTVAAGNITSFTLRPFNVARFRTAGLDLNINYVLNAGDIGTFTLNLIGNYLDQLEFIGVPGADTVDTRGEAFAPKYTVNSDLTWKRGSLSINYGLLWFDRTTRLDNQTLRQNPDVLADRYKYVKEHWQHDVFAGYEVNDRFQFYGGVNNVFGQKPELGTGTYPVNSLGRYFYFGAKMRLKPF